jgi:cellulose synthase/poly-beta-1,6-N-acetylglucosamine synthase-like glycosyltransferase
MADLRVAAGYFHTGRGYVRIPIGRERRSASERWMPLLRTPNFGLRPLPWRDIGLIVLYTMALPFFLYLALSTVSLGTTRALLLGVASAYVVMSAGMTIESIVAYRRKRAPDKPATIPGVESDVRSVTSLTILIVAYLPNEQDIIVETLRRFLAQTAGHREQVDVILAYNTPAALPVEMDLAALASNEPRLRLLKVDGSTTKAENINAALPHVRTNVTALFDADHHAEPYCFERAFRWLGQGYDVVQGRCIIRNHGLNWLTRFISIEFGMMYAVAHSARSLIVDTALFGGSNAYWRTEVLRGLGMNPSMLTEDIDLTIRALLRGHRIIHDRSIISSELAPFSFSAWFYQRLRWSQGWLQVTLEHSRAIVKSRDLRTTQKLYWIYMLPWREIFRFVGPQALPILLAIVLVQWRFGGLGSHWNTFLAATTILTVLSGAFSALAAHRHRAYTLDDVCPVYRAGWERDKHGPPSYRYITAFFILALPAFAFILNIIGLVAWLREWRGIQEWICTPRTSNPSRTHPS